MGFVSGYEPLPVAGAIALNDAVKLIPVDLSIHSVQMFTGNCYARGQSNCTSSTNIEVVVTIVVKAVCTSRASS